MHAVLTTLQEILHSFDPRLLIATLLGLVIGFEREISRKDPGLRTFALICLGSCLFTILSQELVGNGQHDPMRIAAQILPGIGFIGAGTIFRAQERITGLTTAALMWVTAAIGMAVGLNRPDLAFNATIVAVLITVAFGFAHRLSRYKRAKKFKSRWD